MLSYLIIGITYAFAAAVQPGPFQAYIISHALRHGWQRSWPIAFAPLISDGPIIILVLVLLSNISLWMIHMLQLAGGLFLFYLAFGAWQSWRNYEIESGPAILSGQKTLLKAAMVNFLNPNPWLGWSLVMGPLLLQGWQEASENAVLLLAGFYLTMAICTIGIMMLFAGAKHLGPKVNRAALAASIFALGAFGFYQIWLGVTFYG